jgi:hypothetical protein
MKWPMKEKRSELCATAMALAASNLSGVSNDGLCVWCGSVQGGCEPDAQEYKCEGCGNNTVFGAEEVLINSGGFL